MQGELRDAQAGGFRSAQACSREACACGGASYSDAGMTRRDAEMTFCMMKSMGIVPSSILIFDFCWIRMRKTKKVGCP